MDLAQNKPDQYDTAIGLAKYWYQSSLNLLTASLLPLSWLFAALVSLRRFLYKHNLLITHTFNIPVIIVGNLSVGGTGKTPFVIWLARFLVNLGFRPGVISRGVGGKKHRTPRWVDVSDLASEVGDEAILLARHSGCPLVLCTDKVKAVQALVDREKCNIIISDDGLQHYRLGRQVEIVMVDGQRRFGNRCLLPAGPLREPVSRLASADLVVVNEGEKDEWCLDLLPVALVSIQHNDIKRDLSTLKGQKVHAVAAIGSPERFFNMLRRAGLQIIAHPFPDHYFFSKKELDFADNFPIIMTEKDAVKCGKFADERFWYVRSMANMSAGFSHELHRILTLKGVIANDNQTNC